MITFNNLTGEIIMQNTGFFQVLQQMFLGDAKYHSSAKMLAAAGPGNTHSIPYVGNGKSRSHKQQTRKIKKAQRRRKHLKSLRT